MTAAGSVPERAAHVAVPPGRILLHAAALAWRHLRHRAGRNLVLLGAIAISIALPLLLRAVVVTGEAALESRARATPMLLGAPGSPVDLVLGSLWMLDQDVRPIPIGDVDALADLGLARTIPLVRRFRAGGVPLLGTSLDYFAFRSLAIADGRAFAMPGECVLGADAARRLGVAVGDTVLTNPEDLFDLGGSYPLRLRVVGVLDRSNTPDDGIVLCDVRTLWVVAGLGHVHADMETTTDPNAVIARVESPDGGERVIASAAVTPETEITPATIASLHFHGAMKEMPVTAAIVIPNDERSGTILAGRIDGRDDLQLVEPRVVVEELLQRVFRIGRLLGVAFVLVAVATGVVAALVVLLSIRLRRDELDTLRRMGAARGFSAAVVGFEVLAVVGGALAIALGVVLAARPFLDEALVRLLA